MGAVYNIFFFKKYLRDQYVIPVAIPNSSVSMSLHLFNLLSIESALDSETPKSDDIVCVSNLWYFSTFPAFNESVYKAIVPNK